MQSRAADRPDRREKRADGARRAPPCRGERFATKRRVLGHLHVPIGWMPLLKRTGKEALDDNIFDLAAQQSYYFFFALFPALLFVISMASFFPLHTLVDDIVQTLSRVAPRDVINIVTTQMRQLSERKSGGVLTLAFLATIWSSSGAMVSIVTTLNAAYGVTESRPLWKARLTAIGLTIGIAIFILASMFLVLAGPSVAEHLANTMHLGATFKWSWWVLQWPVVFALVVTAIGLVYCFAPDVEQDWIWITPGSVAATALWLLVSLGLKTYYTLVPNANATYGTIGGVMVLMLWFYCSSLALLAGAELNAEIEHASPYGKDPGERVAGEKRVIGRRAQRLYEEKRAKGEVPVKPHAGGGQLRRRPSGRGRTRRAASERPGDRRDRARARGPDGGEKGKGRSPARRRRRPGVGTQLAPESPIDRLETLRGRLRDDDRAAAEIQRRNVRRNRHVAGDYDGVQPRLRDEHGHRHRYRHRHLLNDGIVMVDDDNLRLRIRRRRRRLDGRFRGNLRRLRPSAADEGDDDRVAHAGVLQLLQRRGIQRIHASIDLDERHEHLIAQARLRQFDHVTDGDGIGP